MLSLIIKICLLVCIKKGFDSLLQSVLLKSSSQVIVMRAFNFVTHHMQASLSHGRRQRDRRGCVWAALATWRNYIMP